MTTRSDAGRGTKLNKYTIMKLYNVLDNIICHNWQCGEISALFAWSNSCTIEDRNEQNKIRKALTKIGYKAHFSRCILSVEKTNI